MTRQEIFETIGQAFETPPDKRNKRQVDIADNGICDNVYDRETPELNMLTGAVLDRFRTDMEYGLFDSWLPYPGEDDWTRDCDFIRADFCYLLYWLTDQEFEELGE